MKVARCLHTLCFGCLMLLLCYPLELHAQSKPKKVAGLIQCSVETKTGTWSRGNRLSVAAKIKNISNAPVDLVGVYSFQLTRVDEPMAYWSPVNILDGTPLKLESGRVPSGTVHLEAHETKTIHIDVSKLLWDRNISSIWPNRELFEVVAKGNYDLILDVQTDWEKNSDNVAHVASNKIEIVVR
jgi:hypothetical protein